MIRDIARVALKQLAGPPQPGTGSWGDRYRWPTLPGERSYKAIVGDGMNNSIIAATVLWIARNYPKAPVKLERITGAETTERVRSHPFLSLMRQPNPYYAGVTLDWAMIVSFVTDGNAYKLKRRTSSGRLAEEWYVPHWMMEPKWPSDGSAYLSHYDYMPGAGRVYEVKPQDVVHYRYGLDPHNTRKGMSPLKSLLREVYTDEEAARFSASLLHNLGIPGLIVSPRNETIAPADADAAKAKLTQEFGADNRGGIFVPYGPTDVEMIGFNPEQLDLGAIRDIPEERVTAVLGIPAAVVGFGTGLQATKVGATMREMREIAWEDGIMSLHTVLAPEMRRSELSEFVDRIAEWEVGFDYDDVPELSDTVDDRSARLLDGVKAGAALVADWRGEVGLEVRDHDRVFLRPFAALEVQDGATGRVGGIDVVNGTSAAEPRVPAGTELNARKATWSTAYINDLPDSAFAYIEPGGERDETGRTTPRSKRHFPHHNAQGTIDLPHLRNALSRGPQSDVWPNGKSHLDRHASEEGVGESGKDHVHGVKASQADAGYLRTLDRIVQRATGAMAADLEQRFDDLGVRARNAWVASGAKAIELTPDDEALVVRIIRAMGISEWAERDLAPIFRRYTALVAEATYGAVSQRIGIDVAWDIADPAAVSVIESGGTRAGLLDVTEDTRKALFRAIAAARERGEGPLDIARRIRSEVPAGPFPEAGAKYRAQLIARTETLHAQRASTLAAGKSAGFDEYLVFDARLGDTDTDCEILDQAVVTLERAQQLMNDEHPNGTRSFSPIPRTSGQASREDGELKGISTRSAEIGGDPLVNDGQIMSVALAFRCTACKRLLAEAAGPGTRIKCRCGHTTEVAA